MLNPIEASQQIKDEFIGYITTSFQMADEEYSNQFKKELQREGLVAKGPYLDVSDSFVKGRSLSELMKMGVVSKLFTELEGDIPDGSKELQLNRTLYLHQESAIKKANDNRNLVVTTGTGSGKTECFTIPIINYLLKEKEAGALDDGVRAILIYPMNALANDQMKRLRSTLKNYSDITFGVYNGDTEVNDAEGIISYGKIYKDENGNALKPLPNEIISRKSMQERPPHILVTNYAMLEYMMLRPKDDLVFSGAKLHFLVLDEAHTYKGATGMETSLLIRRLKARISNSNKVVHILTSATLGGEDANDDIISFAHTLCAADFYAEDIIRSKTEAPAFVNPEVDYPLGLFADLAKPNAPLNTILDRYGVSYDASKSDEEIIFDLCLDAKQYRVLRSVATRAMTVSQITSLMRESINVTSEDVVNIITVASMGEKNKTSLLKARYHMFARALEGAFLTVGPVKKLLLERKTYYPELENTWKVFEAVVCNDCGHVGIVGHEIAGNLELPGSIFDDEKEYYLLRGRDEEFDEDEDTDENEIGENDYLLCPHCGEIHHVSQKIDFKCGHDLGEAVRVFKATKITSGGDCKCPSCISGNLKSFYLGYDAATSVLATSLYEQIPESELILKSSVVEQEDDDFDLFGSDADEPVSVVKRKKQFLSFSDSRSEAAYFASYMSKYYKEFLRRRGILHVVQKNKESMAANPWDVTTLVDELTSYFNANRSFAEPGDTGKENLTAVSKKQAWIAVLNELVSSRRGTSLASLGVLNFSYKGNEGPIMNAIAKKYNKDVAAMKDMFNLLVLELVYNGAVESGKCDLTDDEREYVYFTTKPHRFKLCKEAETDRNKSYLHGWVPRKKSNQTYYYNGRVKRVMDTLGISEDEAVGILENYWKSVLVKGQYPLKSGDNSEFYIDADAFVVIPGTEEHPVYECEKCGRITMFNVYDSCASVKCGGKLRKISHADLLANNHFARLYSTDLMKPLHIKEHTAQLGREEQQEYQEMFVKKDINALSCSTTFEMGVDVGDLETVYLRNMPPSPANYVQRAGRAGRSLHSAAYSLTYSKLSSHDFTYYKEPIQMISGKIGVPVFTIKNEKVIQRHIFAVALSMFFAENTDVYNRNNADIFLNGDGVDRFKSFLESKPEALKAILKKSIPVDMHTFMGIDDFAWLDKIIGQEGVLTIAVEDFKETIKWYQEEAERLRQAGDEEGALRAITKLKQFRRGADDGKGRNDLIEFLARNNILPKYGFPIDTVELYQNSDYSKANKLQIVRDLQLAISEYAPDSQVVADDTLYTSRYIRKLPQKTGLDWEVNYIAQCKEPSCKTWNWRRTEPSKEGELCVSCQKVIEKAHWQPAIEPRKGFIAEAKTRAVPMTKPDRLYGSDAYYIGDPQRHIIDKYDFMVHDDAKIFMETSSNDSLMVVCNSDFFVCNRCGFSRSVIGASDDKNNNVFKKSLAQKHKSPWGKDCDGKLYKNKLSHAFKTDVVKIVFGNSRAKNINVMLSVMYALLEATAKVLDIERNDIKGCLHKVKFEGRMIHSIILYDAVAGGAGHVRRLVSDDGEKLQQVIRAAIELTKGCTCKPSCYNCLRNYYNQKVHDVLSRQEAYLFLERFEGTMTPYDRTADEEDSNEENQNDSTVILESDISMGDMIDCVDSENWSSLNYIYPDNYAELFTDFDDKNIPLPDSALVSAFVASKDITTEILFVWNNQRIMIFDDDQPILHVEGWKSFSCSEINAMKFSKLF